MLPEKEWKLKFSVIFLIIFFLSGCDLFVQEKSPEKENQNKNPTPRPKTLEEIEKLKDIKFGLGEKFLVEGIDFLSTMNYERAIYSLSKSIFYNPIPTEPKYFLAKAYLNAGKLKNAIDVLEDIKNSDLESFVIPKLSSIYSRISLSFDLKPPPLYFTLTNIPGIQGRRRIFSLPSSIRFSPEKGVIVSFFPEERFSIIDNQLSISFYKLNGKVLDVVYDDVKKTFWAIDFSTLYEYSEGWLNLNLFNINIKNNFKFNRVNLKKVSVMGEWIYLLDTLSKKIIVVEKENGKILFSFPEVPLGAPTDIECHEDKVFVSDGNEIKVFSKYGKFIHSVTLGERINGFCLFGDKFVVASSKGLSILKADGSNLADVSENKFDDVAIGYEGKLFAISSENNHIEVFGDIYLHTYNLDVDIKGIFVEKFPTIGVLVGVRDIKQNAIDNLRSYNFEVLESGVSIVMPECEQTYTFLRNKNLCIVIEKSREIFEKIDVVENFVRNLLESLKPQDHINVYIVGEDIVDIGRTNALVLYPLEFIGKNFSNFSQKCRLFDGIAKSITDLLYSVRNNAILVITSGNLESDNSQRDIYTVLDYAYNNFIPVYILSLTNNIELKILANSTGGKYYDKSVLLSPGVFLKDYEKSKTFRYLVVFKSLHETLFPEEKLVDVEVRVRYNNLFGKDKIKYVFPKVKKSAEQGH